MPQLTKITTVEDVKVGDYFTTEYNGFISKHTVISIRKTKCRLFFMLHSIMYNQDGDVHIFKDGSKADSKREGRGLKPTTIYFTPIL